MSTTACGLLDAESGSDHLILSHKVQGLKKCSGDPVNSLGDLQKSSKTFKADLRKPGKPLLLLSVVDVSRVHLLSAGMARKLPQDLEEMRGEVRSLRSSQFHQES